MIKIYQCELCNISYKCNSGLWRHNKKLHNDIKNENKLKCSKCIKNVIQDNHYIIIKKYVK